MSYNSDAEGVLQRLDGDCSREAGEREQLGGKSEEAADRLELGDFTWAGILEKVK